MMIEISITCMYVHDNIKLAIYINSRWPPCDLPIIITYQLNDGG